MNNFFQMILLIKGKTRKK